MNLQERIRDICELFSYRNAMYMRGDMRVLFLTDSVRHFGKLIRKGESSKTSLSHALASIFARTCAFAESFANLPIVDAMCEKYPLGKCAYCGNMPCECDQNRKMAIQLSSISIAQKNWGVREWCDHLGSVYGKVNQQQGIIYTQSRLTEEVFEVISAQLLDIFNRDLSQTQIRQNISREFADVFAWILSIAFLLEIDLDTTITERYPEVHRRCGKRPCECGPYYAYIADPPSAETKVGE